MEETKLRIKLNADAIPDICRKFSQFDSEFDIYSGRKVIDGKDLLGFYSIDLRQPINVRCILSKNETVQKVMDSIKDYIDEEELKY